MTVISLTSIPPRFDRLGAVLESLMAQGADRVVLALSRDYVRFPGPVSPPPVPVGVEIIWGEDDGPAGKFLTAQAACPDARVVICDDDCIYAPGWLGALEAAHDGRNAVAGSVFDVARLGRIGGLVAQGFAGVLLPAGLCLPKPPDACRYADDLWLSAVLEQQGVAITPCPEARALVTALEAPDPLQAEARSEVYERAAREIERGLGLWPAL